MKNLVIASAMLLVLSVSASAWWDTKIDTVEEKYPNAQLKEQYQTVLYEGNEETYKYGSYRSFYENGTMEWEGYYESNAKVGTWVKWDSTYQTVLHYRNGKLHGLCSWMKEGNMINTLFNNGDLVLDEQAFYLNGEVLVTIKERGSDDYVFSCYDRASPYYNPDLDLWVEWNRQCKFTVGHKVDGKKQGIWVQWSEAGEMISTEYYEDGVLTSSD